MQTSAKLYPLTATQVIDLVKKDYITVEEYALALLNRIKERDEVVKAWEYLGALHPF